MMCYYSTKQAVQGKNNGMSRWMHK